MNWVFVQKDGKREEERKKEEKERKREREFERYKVKEIARD